MSFEKHFSRVVEEAAPHMRGMLLASKDLLSYFYNLGRGSAAPEVERRWCGLIVFGLTSNNFWRMKTERLTRWEALDPAAKARYEDISARANDLVDKTKKEISGYELFGLGELSMVTLTPRMWEREIPKTLKQDYSGWAARLNQWRKYEI